MRYSGDIQPVASCISENPLVQINNLRAECGLYYTNTKKKGCCLCIGVPLRSIRYMKIKVEPKHFRVLSRLMIKFTKFFMLQ